MKIEEKKIEQIMRGTVFCSNLTQEQKTTTTKSMREK